MRISILFSALSSYTVAFFRELAVRESCELQLIFKPSSRLAPYKEFDLSFCRETSQDVGEHWRVLEKKVKRFAPDCVLMCSWNFKNYLMVSRELRKRGTLVIATMDNQWHGTLKQILGVLTSKWYLKPAIDNFLVAGDRQAAFARRLGYERVMYGYYAADVKPFSAVALGWTPKPAFLFVGRLVKEKGVDILAHAYEQYRRRTSDAWRLIVVGTGPLRKLLENIDGVDMRGFVQPQNLPHVMSQSGCLILPSRFEPWGVVVHEAVAAGLPVVCTSACGASTYFVRDGLNGYIVPTDSSALTDAMSRLSLSQSEQLLRMSSFSRTLGELWTPTLLAEYFARSVQHEIRYRMRKTRTCRDSAKQ